MIAAVTRRLRDFCRRCSSPPCFAASSARRLSARKSAPRRSRHRSAWPRRRSDARCPTNWRSRRASTRKEDSPHCGCKRSAASTSRRQLSAEVISRCSHPANSPHWRMRLSWLMSISVAAQRRRARRHQEIPPRRAEGLDDLAHCDLVAAGDLDQLAELRRPAHGFGEARSRGQRAEDGDGDLADAPASSSSRISRPCAASAPLQPAQLIVVGKLSTTAPPSARCAAATDHRRFSTCCISGSWSARRTRRSSWCPVSPSSQGAKDGEVVQEAVDQRRLDVEPADRGRPDDRLAHLRRASCAASDTSPALIASARPSISAAGAEIFGAHGDDDVDARLGERRARAFQKQRNEGLRLLALRHRRCSGRAPRTGRRAEAGWRLAADFPRSHHSTTERGPRARKARSSSTSSSSGELGWTRCAAALQQRLRRGFGSARRRVGNRRSASASRPDAAGRSRARRAGRS